MKTSIDDMYDMMRQNGVRIDMRDEVEQETLGTRAEHFEGTVIIQANAFVHGQIGPRTEEVSKRVQVGKSRCHRPRGMPGIHTS